VKFKREHTRRIYLGTIPIGAGMPVVVQSMTNTDTRNVQATLMQITKLAAAGCEIVRCAVPNIKAAKAFRIITKTSPIPVIADIHYSVKLAVIAIENGAAALRINPGNIGGERAINLVVDVARAYGVSIRIGVNSGSIPKENLIIYNGPTPEAIVQTALSFVNFLEMRNFMDVKVSLKSSNVLDTISACRRFAELSNCPQHLGITEAGGLTGGAIKSAVGIGSLLLDGIGDTLRVSLTSDPIHEVEAAWHILRTCGLRRRGVEIISCPTCGRTEIDLIGLLAAAEKELAVIKTQLTVAIMGCIVNGPGEALHADVGIAAGHKHGVVFSRKRPIRKVPEADLLSALMHEVRIVQDDQH